MHHYLYGEFQTSMTHYEHRLLHHWGHYTWEGYDQIYNDLC